MRIERQQIILAGLNLDQVKLDQKITGVKTKKTLPLNADQIRMLEMFQSAYTLKEVVQAFLDGGKIISFQGLYQLILFLLEEELIRNPEFKSYFQRADVQATSVLQDPAKKAVPQKGLPDPVKELEKLSFFRSLDPDVLEIFLKNSVLIPTVAGVEVCRNGATQRSLLVLLRGQASVYRNDELGRRKRVAVLSEGSVFGEIGFFLGAPRTADVVTDTDSVILRIKYIPEIFDDMIKTDKAKSLQTRFWLIHALLKSPIFRKVPDDCFDSLVFAGDIMAFPADEVICRENDPGDRCYIIIQGTVVVSQKGKSIALLSQGDFFGEMALMVSGGTRTASVQAQTEIMVLEILQRKFYQILSENLILACEFEKIALSHYNKDQDRRANS